jgi:hypothetical protein
LAAILLDREDLTPIEAAPLYLHAQATRRRAIRDGVVATALLRRRDSAGSGGDACTRLVEAAESQDEGAFDAALSAMLGFPAPIQFRFGESSRHELLALCLMAASVPEEDSIRVFLTLDPAIARSVKVVFGLVEVLRTTTQPAAAYLVEAILDPPAAMVGHGGRYVPALHPSGVPARPSAIQRPAGAAWRAERLAGGKSA